MPRHVFENQLPFFRFNGTLKHFQRISRSNRSYFVLDHRSSAPAGLPALQRPWSGQPTFTAPCCRGALPQSATTPQAPYRSFTIDEVPKGGTARKRDRKFGEGERDGMGIIDGEREAGRQASRQAGRQGDISMHHFIKDVC